MSPAKDISLYPRALSVPGAFQSPPSIRRVEDGKAAVALVELLSDPGARRRLPRTSFAADEDGLRGEVAWEFKVGGDDDFAQP